MRKPPVRLLSLGVALTLAVVLAACGNSAGTGATPTPKVIKVGLVTDTGGLREKRFNHLAALGLRKGAVTGNMRSGLTRSGDLAGTGAASAAHAHHGDWPHRAT